jgi:hypothetical protein
MGEEFTVAPGAPAERCVAISVSGTAPVDRVQLIKNGRTLVSWPGKMELDLEIAHVDRVPERDTDYYFVHVRQMDGEQAWSSPIWVTSGSGSGDQE